MKVEFSCQGKLCLIAVRRPEQSESLQGERGSEATDSMTQEPRR